MTKVEIAEGEELAAVYTSKYQSDEIKTIFNKIAAIDRLCLRPNYTLGVGSFIRW